MTGILWDQMREIVMPSPFHGMDPYLEAPDIWPDLHDSLASEIRAVLNASLPTPFYARLEMRPEVGIVEEGGTSRRIVSDVAVVRPPPRGQGPQAAVAEAPRRTISPSSSVTIRVEPHRHLFVEVRDPARGHELVTMIEIVSPSNKRRGADRRSYSQKQGEVLDSSANLIELDFHRGGQRLLPHPLLEEYVDQLEPPPDYLVLVNRGWLRIGAATDFQVFSILITDPLPCIPVPLRQGIEEVPLDLQFVFTRAYNAGPYRRGAVDYERPAEPPLQGERVTWAERLLREAGLRPSAPA